MTYEHGFIAEAWFQKTTVFFVFWLEVYSAFLTGVTIIGNNSSETALLVPVIVVFVKRDHKLIALLSAHPDLNCALKKDFMMSIHLSFLNMVCSVYWEDCAQEGMKGGSWCGVSI